MDATETVNRLQFQQYAEEQNLRESSARFGSVSLHIEEETLDSASPIADSFLEEGGPEAILTMINFSVEEFTTLWGIVEVEMQLAWTMGRGRKRETTPRDAFFMALTALKHYDTWAKHAVDFPLQTATFEKMMYKVFEIIEPVLFEHYVRPAAMADQRAAGNTFANYPNALYATDVTFQPAYRPAGSFIEQKQYFSGKHKLYGYKLECSVAYPGFAIDVSVHAPGSKSDLTIMMEWAEVHRSMLKKTRAERAEPDVGEGAREYPGEWAVLVDMGYQGAQSHLRTVQPKRKPRGGTLNHDDLARNDRVASDRVLVENFFGRMSKLWRVMYATYKWNECRYDQLSRLCVALTNAHAHLHPLRLQDRDHCSGAVFAKRRNVTPVTNLRPDFRLTEGVLR